MSSTPGGQSCPVLCAWPDTAPPQPRSAVAESGSQLAVLVVLGSWPRGPGLGELNPPGEDKEGGLGKCRGEGQPLGDRTSV